MNTTEVQEFGLDEILSLTVGTMSLSGWKGVYKISSFLVGRGVQSFELPDIQKFGSVILLQRYPMLKSVDDVQNSKSETLQEYIAKQEEKIAKRLFLTPFTQEEVDNAIQLLKERGEWGVKSN